MVLIGSTGGSLMITGDLGIGTTTPQYKLDVSGSINSRNKIKENGFDLIPTGTILPYAGSTVPSGYLFCNGSTISQQTYSNLFNIIGTMYTYRPNDGSSFDLPDLRARVPIGTASGITGTNLYSGTTLQTSTKILGNKGGKETYQLSINEMPTHNHGGTVSTYEHTHTYEKQNTNTVWWSAAVNYNNSDGSAASRYSSTGQNTATTRNIHDHTISSQGLSHYHNIMQPYLVINYIIKF